MADDKEPAEEGSRRFRFTRKVKTEPLQTREERDLKAAEVDDADRGTPEQDRALRRGCGSCLNVTLLLFVIMIGSIIATCAIRR